MAWAFLTIGLIILVSAIRNKQSDLWNLVKSDFTGDNNFFYWVIAIIILVALGSYRPIKPITDGFLGLVILVIILASYRDKKDIFASFVSQVKAGTA